MYKLTDLLAFIEDTEERLLEIETDVLDTFGDIDQDAMRVLLRMFEDKTRDCQNILSLIYNRINN